MREQQEEGRVWCVKCGALSYLNQTTINNHHQVGARLWSFPGNRLNSSVDAVGGPGRSSLLLFRLPETP